MAPKAIRKAIPSKNGGFSAVKDFVADCYIRVSTHIAGLAAKPKDVLDTLDLTNFGVKTLLVNWSLFRYN